MNANDLANELEQGAAICESHLVIARRVTKAAEMLRFQQDEINALREQVQYLQTQVYGGTTK
jgi:type II secretory pathway component PulK